MFVQGVPSVIIALVPAPEPKEASGTWDPIGHVRQRLQQSCERHGITSTSAGLVSIISLPALPISLLGDVDRPRLCADIQEAGSATEVDSPAASPDADRLTANVGGGEGANGAAQAKPVEETSAVDEASEQKQEPTPSSTAAAPTGVDVPTVSEHTAADTTALTPSHRAGEDIGEVTAASEPSAAPSGTGGAAVEVLDAALLEEAADNEYSIDGRVDDAVAAPLERAASPTAQADIMAASERIQKMHWEESSASATSADGLDSADLDEHDDMGAGAGEQYPTADAGAVGSDSHSPVAAADGVSRRSPPPMPALAFVSIPEERSPSSGPRRRTTPQHATAATADEDMRSQLEASQASVTALTSKVCVCVHGADGTNTDHLHTGC